MCLILKCSKTSVKERGRERESSIERVNCKCTESQIGLFCTTDYREEQAIELNQEQEIQCISLLFLVLIQGIYHIMRYIGLDNRTCLLANPSKAFFILNLYKKLEIFFNHLFMFMLSFSCTGTSYLRERESERERIQNRLTLFIKLMHCWLNELFPLSINKLNCMCIGRDELTTRP